MANVQEFSKKITSNIEQVIVGKHSVIELAVVGLLCEGHLLIEDMPGVGKTILARSLAKSLGCSFSRVQFTPDMLPSDVTGVSIFNQSSREFEYRAGPLMAQIVLADEINRATPKTQSALLEAMDERQITVDGIAHQLPQPFMVLATQNPIEYEGTFPLPEAQLDRFFMRVRLGYPSAEDEMRVLQSQQFQHPINKLKEVAHADELRVAQEAVKAIFVSPAVQRYIVDLTQQTRAYADVYLGASPRGSLALSRAGQAYAALHGRDYVLPDDIKALASAVLSHRVILAPAARLKSLTTEKVLKEILLKTPVPSSREATK
jgi:MoxR-like ATPase